MQKVVRNFNLSEYDHCSEQIRIELQNLCFDDEGNVAKNKVLTVKALLNNQLSNLNVYIHEINDLLQYM